VPKRSNTSGVTYLWTGPGTITNATSAVATVNTPGTYTLKVTTSQGCIASDSMVLTVVPYCIKPMEAFSPNGDGINDLFVIRGISNYPENHFVVFNRWGNKVFEKDGYLSTWDGTTSEGINVGGNELPVGTYFYVLTLGDGSPYYKGTIYLNR